MIVYKHHLRNIPPPKVDVLPVPWRMLIPKDPSIEELKAAFKYIFKCDIDVCTVEVKDKGGINEGLIVETPNTIYDHGGFGYYTDSPVFHTEERKKWLFYDGGITWGVDDNRKRFYRIDRRTGLPAKWEEVIHITIISKCLYFFEDNRRNLTE